MTTTTLASERNTLTPAARRKSLRAAAVGNALEWFDWTLYGTFSVYLAANFFEHGDPTSALLAVLAVFAVGFIARPLGGWLFGILGDRHGRKLTLLVTMTLLAVTSLALALAPTYDQVGLFASVTLVVIRLLQGLAHGGESGVSYTYIAEIAPAERRALWTSSVYVSVMIGVMAATGLGAILTATLDAEAMNTWGWRIGFAAGALLGVYALFLRRSAEESDVFENEQKDSEPEEKLTARQMLVIAVRIIFICAASNTVYYVWVTFAPTNAISGRGMDPNGAYIASLLAQFIVVFTLPLFGILADRWGRKPTLALFGIGVIVVVFPVDKLVTDQPWTLFAAQLAGLLVWASLAGMFPALLAEQVPTAARARGVGLMSSLTVAIFGGTAPYLNTWLTSMGMSWVFSLWLVFLGGLAIVGSLVIKETARKPLAEITLNSQLRGGGRNR
jgi:MFS transporter, MHS family, alpha-ketoglutarate permease